MRVLGIDPGPDGFAWAVYDDHRNDILGWGDLLAGINHVFELQPGWGNAVAIEEPGYNSLPGRAKSLVQIAFQAGVIAGQFAAKGFQVNKLNRATIACVLTGSVRSGDAEINHALGVLIPSFAAVRNGLNGHHRAAAAVAYVGLGRIRARQVELAAAEVPP